MNANKLYGFTLRLARGKNTDLPPGLDVALAPTYAAAPNAQAAIELAIKIAAGLGLIYQDIFGEVHEPPIHDWDNYVAAAWPDFSDGFPRQREMVGLVHDGAVFFGPFQPVPN
jgi:hypothetical protein